MSAKVDVIVKRPDECSARELEEFRKLVLAGGEVAAHGLAGRIRSAAALGFAKGDQFILGVAALKRPAESYRKSISSKTGVRLPRSALAYELGWVFVTPKARRQGVSRRLVDAVVSAATDAGLFATSRSDNVAMHRSLERNGFAAAGNSYGSEHGGHTLRLFTREGRPLPEQKSGMALRRRSS